MRNTYIPNKAIKDHNDITIKVPISNLVPTKFLCTIILVRLNRTLFILLSTNHTESYRPFKSPKSERDLSTQFVFCFQKTNSYILRTRNQGPVLIIDLEGKEGTLEVLDDAHVDLVSTIFQHTYAMQNFLSTQKVPVRFDCQQMQKSFKWTCEHICPS